MTTTAVQESKTTAPPAVLQAVPLPGAMEIPLDLIVPSKTNRRQVRNAERDAELAESIRMRGVQQAIVVRVLIGDKKDGIGLQYEVVCGHRRFEMSRKAGKTTIPAIVRNLTNAEALEVQNIENLQREDLDPLDRAEAIHDLYQQYLKGMSPKDAIAKISGRLNCKERTLYNMMSLRNLLPDVQKAIAAGEILMSTGYVLAALSPASQTSVWKWLKQELGYGPVSVRRVADFIQSNVFRRLTSATWDLEDAQLVPAAGACTACPKNTAVSPQLAPDEKKATCTDIGCFNSKSQAFLVNIVTKAKKEAADGKAVLVAGDHGQTTLVPHAIDRSDWKEAKEGSCPYAVLAVIASGSNAGKKQFVCMNRKCSKHWQSWERTTTYADRGSGRALSAEEKRKRLQEQRGKKLDLAYRVAASAEIRKRVTVLKTADLQEIAAVLYDRLDNRLQVPIMEAMGWKVGDRYAYRGLDAPAKQIAELKPADLNSFIALLAIAENVLPVGDYWGAKNGADLTPFAKRHKIDLDKIKAQAEAPLKAKFKSIDERKKKAEASTSTNAKAKKAGKKKAA